MPAIDTQGPKKKRARKKPVQTGSRGDSAAERRSPPKPKPVAGPPAPVRTGSRGDSAEARRPAPKPKLVRPAPADTKSEKEFKRAERHKRTPEYKRTLRKVREERQRRQMVSGGVAGPPAPSESIREGILRRRLERENADREIKAKIPENASPSELSAQIRRGRELDRSIKVMHRKKTEATAKKLAPVADVLEETTRPLHAVAGGTRAAIRGENVSKAALKGIKNKEKYTFSDVLKEAGVSKKVRGPLGFALDVAADPTTYVTGGVGGVGKKAATDAARKATKKAVKQGLSKEQAQRFGARAAKQAAKKHDQERGMKVKFAGKEVPGVRRATSKAATPVRAVGRMKPAQVAKRAVEEVRPTITPTGVSRESFEEVRRATRTARAKATRGTFEAQQKAVAYKKAIGKKNFEKVIDAIESGTRKELPEHLRGPAKRVEDQFKHARRLQRRSGVKVPERKGYVPHQLTDDALKEKGATVQGVGRRVIAPSSSKARKEQRSLKELREQEPGKYEQNLPKVYAKRMDEATTSAARANLNRRLADVGRDVKKGKPIDLREGEQVFRVKGSDLTVVSDKKELQRLVDHGPQNGRYVVLHERLVKQASANVRPEPSQLGKTWDKATGTWKFIATVPNPGFHARNLAGDTQNAYLAESAPRLVKNIGTSARGLRGLKRREEALRTLGKTPKPSKATVRLKGGEKVKLDDLVREAEQAGAIRTGFIARELPELQAAGRTSPKVERTSKLAAPAKRAGRAVKRTAQSREDLIRLATYIGGRRRGLSPEKAAERSTKYHFDYADLTSTERNVLRRIAPFYTFSSRNIPLQAKSILTKPGKYAQYQKIREEVGKAFGADPNFEGDLSEYEQRSAPIPIKWKGKNFTISLGPSGLPITDLNELPTSGDPSKLADEWMSRAISMLNPGIKSPIELFANYNFFFRDQLEKDTGPLVPAPEVVSTLPEKLRKQLGIVPDYKDPRTGKSGWGWPAKADYLASILPGPFGAAKRMGTPLDRPGGDVASKSLAYGTGLRLRKIDPVSVRLGERYDEQAKIQKQMAGWRQRGVNADNPNRQYTKLLERQKQLKTDIEGLKKKRGDKTKSKSAWGGGKWGSKKSGWDSKDSSWGDSKAAGWGP